MVPPQVRLRPPGEVMRLSRMGAYHPTRLSFTRQIIRALAAEGAAPKRVLWEIGPEGFGRAVYEARLGGRPYSLIAISTPLADEMRSDRVIAEAWDTTYVLFDGAPDRAEVDRIVAAAPRQEASRYAPRDLVLSRANRSQRLFNHTVERLRAGGQPDAALVDSTGYLMRTTAVYGNGKFGIADRARVADRPGLSGPFQVEMLTVWLIRAFTLDLVEHVGGARLDPALRRHLGVGNATGLGMAPFLANHPTLLSNWIMARETALATVLGAPATAETRAAFAELLARATAHVRDWNVADKRQAARIAALEDALSRLSADAPALLARDDAWRALWSWAAGEADEMRELMVSLLTEPQGALIDRLGACMGAGAPPRLDPAMRCEDLARLLKRRYGWALKIDWADAEARRRFWYQSVEKMEPRIGDRYAEPGAEKEHPLDIARRACALAEALAEGRDETVGDLVARRPEHRLMARRAQMATRWPYGEIHDNLTAADCLPIDMLRCKLSFFGATRFDPKSDLWTRVTLFQGAPGLEDVTAPGADDWAFPVLAR